MLLAGIFFTRHLPLNYKSTDITLERSVRNQEKGFCILPRHTTLYSTTCVMEYVQM